MTFIEHYGDFYYKIYVYHAVSLLFLLLLAHLKHYFTWYIKREELDNALLPPLLLSVAAFYLFSFFICILSRSLALGCFVFL